MGHLLLGPHDFHLTAEESWHTTVVDLMCTSVPVTLATFLALTVLIVHLFGPLKGKPLCSAIPIAKVLIDILFIRCRLKVGAEGCLSVQVLQRFINLLLFPR